MHGIQNVAHRGRLDPEVQTARLDPGQVENIVNQCEQMPTAGEDVPEELAPFLSKETLKRMFEAQRAGMTTEALVKLAPFLGKEVLETLLRPKA